MFKKIIRIKSLNPYVKCDIKEGLDILTQIKNYNLIIISELTNIEKLYKINENCRNKNMGFIYTLALGITGVCFVDFGEHNITDKDGEEIKTYLIKNILKKGEFFIDKTISNKNFNIAKGNYLFLFPIN